MEWQSAFSIKYNCILLLATGRQYHTALPLRRTLRFWCFIYGCNWCLWPEGGGVGSVMTCTVCVRACPVICSHNRIKRVERPRLLSHGDINRDNSMQSVKCFHFYWLCTTRCWGPLNSCCFPVLFLNTSLSLNPFLGTNQMLTVHVHIHMLTYEFLPALSPAPSPHSIAALYWLPASLLMVSVEVNFTAPRATPLMLNPGIGRL